MKLSEAMMLGSVTCKMVRGDLNTCALGAAANAIGIAKMANKADWSRINSIKKVWPWLDEEVSRLERNIDGIVFRFDDMVCFGKMTLEQLADYVKTIEPSCGDCCKFDCSCVKAETADAPIEVLVGAA